MNLRTVFENVRQISSEFAQDRRARQNRRHLEPGDFERLREAGFLLTGVHSSHGGLWEDDFQSLSRVCDMLRILGQGDSSVALVAAMHPSVIFAAGWLTIANAPAPYSAAWAEQRAWVFETARHGAWWGTIISEPGSGGDSNQSRAIATLSDPPLGYRISGVKHFGSGSGLASYMVTTAVPEGESIPDNFIVDMRDVPWDGSEGLTLVGAWDGHGMIATQSHGMRFDDFPGTRSAWPDRDARLARTVVNPVGCMFSSVIVGIVEIALDTARQQLERRRESLGAFETVEWTRAEMEGWLIEQAYRGMLREIAQGSTRSTRLGKTAIAELSASVLDRLCKILGGSTYARHSPFGYWLQDVRALGYLRPPWPLAFDLLFSGIPHEPVAEILTIDSSDSHDHAPVVPQTDPARAS